MSYDDQVKEAEACYQDKYDDDVYNVMVSTIERGDLAVSETLLLARIDNAVWNACGHPDYPLLCWLELFMVISQVQAAKVGTITPYLELFTGGR